MRIRTLAVLIFATSLALAQTQAPAKPAAKSPAPAAKAKTAAQTPKAASAQPSTATTAVPQTAAVVTIPGVCEGKAVPAAQCKTVLTRAEFERILAAIASNKAGPIDQIPSALRRNIATQYAQLVVVASNAEKKGIQDNPETQELVKFARMEALAEAYSRVLRKQLAPTDAEIKAFYDANTSRLEQFTLLRLVVPRAPGKDPKDAEENAKAEKFRARVVAGEPFDALQKEAMQGSKMSPPDTRVTIQKGSLPAAQEAVFNLKPGEVSQVFNEPSAAFIYKLESKQTVPLAQVKNDIEQRLTQEKMQQAMQGMMASATPVLNDQYFGPEAPAQGSPAASAPAKPAQTTPAQAPATAPAAAAPAAQQPATSAAPSAGPAAAQQPATTAPATTAPAPGAQNPPQAAEKPPQSETQPK